MAPAANLDWLYHLLGYTLAAAGLVLLLWALFWDRSRGRRRCPKCWYDMASTEGRKCPECGREARSERWMFATRRRWRFTALSLILFSAAFIAHCWPQIKAGGWTAPIPSRALLEIFPLTGPGTILGDALLDRYHVRIKPLGGNVAPSDEQLQAVIHRAARGNWLARPTSDRWRKSYGEILRKLQGRVMLRQSGAIEVLPGPRVAGRIPAFNEWEHVPPAISVRARAKWPRGMPMTVYTSAESWSPHWKLIDEEVTWTATDSAGTRVTGTMQGYRMYFNLSHALSGHIVVEGIVKVFQFSYPDRKGTRREVLAVPIRFEYDTVASIDEVMHAATSPGLEQFLASAVTAVHTDNGAIQFKLAGAVPTGFDDVAFGARLEVLAGEKVIMTAFIRGVGIDRVLNGICTFGSVDYADNDDDASRLRKGDVDPSWRLRMRTDPCWALSELDATRYWKGDVTVPLTAGKFNMRIRTTRTPPPATPPAKPSGK